MTVEELMKPRYMVIADFPDLDAYPNNRFFKVGDIIELKVCEDREMRATLNYNDHYISFDVHFFDKYPAIFAHLHWYEKRAESDMPQYLKCIKTPDQRIMPGDVMEIVEWFAKDCGRFDRGICVCNTGCFLPASKEEYLTFINQKK